MARVDYDEMSRRYNAGRHLDDWQVEPLYAVIDEHLPAHRSCILDLGSGTGQWSGRLALVSGDSARRAIFRIVLAMFLTQVIYTLAFAQGAWKHEFWQYYLTVPVAVMAAGLLTWLTVAGGDRREFRFGLADRVGWAAAALIPLMAIGPMAWRLWWLRSPSTAGSWHSWRETVKNRGEVTNVASTRAQAGAASWSSVALLGRSKNGVPLMCTKPGSPTAVTWPPAAGMTNAGSARGPDRLPTRASCTRRFAT